MSQVVVNEITIVGSRCGRFHPALEIVPEYQAKLSRLISHRFLLAEGVDAFEAAASPGSMKVILQMG
jgi:threonine dehydrogenase-like Zn-dependent dehydrogenase